MQHYSIAIVGLGPKGLYALERLLARFHQINVDSKIQIHVFEKTGIFGAGVIYNPNQPEYLLMNYPNRNINVWHKENPLPIVPKPLDFTSWLNLQRPVSKNDFSSRSTVGKYLISCFNQLEKYKNKNITIIKHKARVTDIESDEENVIIQYVDDNNTLHILNVDQVMLTTGHSSCKEKSVNNQEDNIIPFVYPVGEKLKSICKNSEVGVKGLGLTFVDTVLALTEGRGGRFENTENGKLKYRSSGEEPKKIYPFSRTGLPMVPRNAYEGLQPYTPVYFTRENILKRVELTEKIDFKQHVLPLFIVETEYRYYRILFEKHGLHLKAEKNIEALQKQINDFHEQFTEVKRFDFEGIFDYSFLDADTEESKFEALIKESLIGSESSPFMAAAMTWGRLSETFNSLYSFGGMKAESNKVFDMEFRSKLNRISYGPPTQNMKKIVALVESGFIDLKFSKSPEVKKIETGWHLVSSVSEIQKVNFIVDARIPTFNSSKNWSELLSNLKRRGQIRSYKIYNSTTYNVGCPEINRQGNVIDATGNVINNISLYGTLTEGITYDNDTLSRTRNNFASQWALNVLEKYNRLKLNIQNA